MTEETLQVIPADPALLAAERSESQTELFKALAACQSEFDTIQATAENDYYHSKYAPLWAIWEHVRPILKKHGLLLIQEPIPSTIEEGAKMRNILAHSSGEWRSSVIVIPVDLGKEGKGKKAPAFGSAYTYGRRYAMSGILGVATSAEDNDASGIDLSGPATPADREEKGWKAWADAECMRYKDSQTIVHLDGWYLGSMKKLETMNAPEFIPQLLEKVYEARKEELVLAEDAKRNGMDPDGDIPQ